MRIANLLALAATLAGTLAAASVPAEGQSVDPVGDYTWSFSMENDVVHGTMNIAKTDTGYRAVLTSDHTQGPLPAKTVTVTGNRVVVYLVGDFGEFTLDMKLGETPIPATFKLVTDNGPADGPITVERTTKSPPGE